MAKISRRNLQNYACSVLKVSILEMFWLKVIFLHQKLDEEANPIIAFCKLVR